jgi:tetrahydromethanopterin S-methyltransferase subunit B
MFGRKKKEEIAYRDFSDEFAMLFERVKNLEARVEALEHSVGKSSTPPLTIPQAEQREGVVRGKTRRPFLEEK